MGQELCLDILPSFLGSRCSSNSYILSVSGRSGPKSPSSREGAEIGWRSGLLGGLRHQAAPRQGHPPSQQPAPQESIDTAVLWTTLMHVPKIQQAEVLAEVKKSSLVTSQIWRVLRPGGQLVVFDNDMEGWSLTNGKFDVFKVRQRSGGQTYAISGDHGALHPQLGR